MCIRTRPHTIALNGFTNFGVKDCIDAICCRPQAGPTTNSRPLRRTRSEEHTSELQSLMRISYAVFCLKKKKQNNIHNLISDTHTSELTSHQRTAYYSYSIKQ